MLKKILFICAALFCTAESHAEPIDTQIPTEFTVTQHWLSWTNEYSIATKEMKLGTIYRKFFSLFEYHFLDNNDQLQAIGKMRWFNLLPVFDVTDANEQPIGRIEEQASWFFPTFRFISPANFIQAEASRNFWGTTFTVIDTLTEEVIATMHRNFFSFKDDWTVKIHNPELFLQKGIDFRLFVVVMAFQTDRDTWNRNMNSFISYSVPSNDSEKPVKTTDADLADSIEDLRAELERLRASLNPVEPKEEDFVAVDAIVTEKLKEESENASQDDASLSQVERGYKVLLPLLTQEGLSPSQKSALFLMMDQHLKSIK